LLSYKVLTVLAVSPDSSAIVRLQPGLAAWWVALHADAIDGKKIDVASPVRKTAAPDGVLPRPARTVISGFNPIVRA
jgi:hypothetical protein